MSSIVRSVLAVLGGIALFSTILFALESFTPGSDATTTGRLLWLGVLTVSMVAGGSVTAWIAPRARTGHAVGMALLQAAMTFVAMLTVRTAAEPLWFWLAGMALMPPAAWVGAARAQPVKRPGL